MSSNVVGDFELLELIGRGATGRVWRGRHRVTGDEVAVKVLRGEFADDPEARTRFLAEGHLLADRPLPGAVRVREVIDDDQSPAIVMDLVEAPTLRQVLGADAPLAPERATRLVRGLAVSLAAAHATGLVHGDVKPENILVTGRRSADEATVLTDFGLARVLETSAATHSRSQVIGTPHYAAPEIHQGERTGAPSDVYALGVILYEQIVGRRPFEAPTTVGIIQKHLNEEPEPTGDFSAPLWEAVTACLSKEAAARPTAKTVVDRLERILDEQLFTPEALPTSQWRKTLPPPQGEEQTWKKRRRVGLVAAGVAAALVLGGGAVLATRLQTPDAPPPSAAIGQVQDHSPQADQPATTAPTTTTSTTPSSPPATSPTTLPSPTTTWAESLPTSASPTPSRAEPISSDANRTQSSSPPTPTPRPDPPRPTPRSDAPNSTPTDSPSSNPTSPSLGAQSAWRRTTLPDGRKLEVNLQWMRTQTHNDWTEARYRVTGGDVRPFAINFSLYEKGRGRVFFRGLDAAPAGTWNTLRLAGNATMGAKDESFLVQVYEAERKPKTRLGAVSFDY